MRFIFTPDIKEPRQRDRSASQLLVVENSRTFLEYATLQFLFTVSRSFSIFVEFFRGYGLNNRV